MRASLFALVQTTAQHQLVELGRAKRTLADTSLLPWHDAVRRARALAVEHLEARTAVVAAVSTSYDAYGRPVPQLVVTAQRARAALLAISGDGARERVERAVPLP